MMGSLELLVMLATRLAVRGTPAEVYRHLEVECAKPPSFGAVYTTLDRLTTKHMLVEHARRDGRRVFGLTEEGRSRLRNTLAVIDGLRGPPRT